MIKRAKLPLYFVLAGLLFATTGGPAPALEPHAIDAIISLTGPGAFLGKDEYEALKVIETTVNKAGGVDGQPIKINILDDQSNPQTAVQLASNSIAQHESAILGPSLAATCKAVGALVSRGGPVTYCFTSGIKVQKGNYVFSASFSTIDSMGATIRYIHSRGWNRVAYIVSTDATGQDAEDSLNSILNAPENKAITVVDREHFNVNDLSTAAQMARIKAANPQAVIAWSTGSPLGTLLRGAHDSGLDIPVFTTGGNIEYAEMEQFGQYLPKEIYFSGCPGLTPGQSVDKRLRASVGAFDRAFQDAHIRPEQGHILAWDATLFVLDALKKLGMDATPAQVQDYLDGLRNAPGAVGSYDFLTFPQRGLGPDDVLLVRWDATKGTWVAASRR
jgi:branched-chain amino acid transport system substrate-binding protein